MEKTMRTVRILAISGSLRPNSSNNAVISLTTQIAPDNVSFSLYNGLGSLPHFDDSKDPTDEVKELREKIGNADGVLICSPEYAFGIPGSLKNAIDWTVSSGEFVGKPTALITAATGGEKAHAAWEMVFTALSANMPTENKLLISFVRAKMDEHGRIIHAETIENIKKVIESLIATIQRKSEIN